MSVIDSIMQYKNEYFRGGIPKSENELLYSVSKDEALELAKIVQEQHHLEINKTGKVNASIYLAGKGEFDQLFELMRISPKCCGVNVYPGWSRDKKPLSYEDWCKRDKYKNKSVNAINELENKNNGTN